MQALQEIEHLLTTLTRAEKAQVLQWVVRDLGDAFPGIERTPGVCGGEPCIVRTRIPVWVLVQARRLGTSEADLLRSYPTLRAEDLANAWAYARAHHEDLLGGHHNTPLVLGTSSPSRRRVAHRALHSTARQAPPGRAVQPARSAVAMG